MEIVIVVALIAASIFCNLFVSLLGAIFHGVLFEIVGSIFLLIVGYMVCLVAGERKTILRVLIFGCLFLGLSSKLYILGGAIAVFIAILTD